jgi:hypothetical protein
LNMAGIQDDDDHTALDDSIASVWVDTRIYCLGLIAINQLSSTMWLRFVFFLFILRYQIFIPITFE